MFVDAAELLQKLLCFSELREKATKQAANCDPNSASSLLGLIYGAAVLLYKIELHANYKKSNFLKFQT